ncbi:MAG: acylphosphatase [Alphaproteobacteria bacterium]|nr:acylphosphatase [Alphaproteobacteria bacterium]
MIKIYRLLIQGRVQRVWFRGWAVKNASHLGLGGFVRNLENGDVELVIKGSEEALQKMLTACFSGPPLARVDNILVEDLSESIESQNIDDIFTRR